MALLDIPAVGLIRDRFLDADLSDITFLLNSANSAAAAFIILAPGEQIDEIGVSINYVYGTPSFIVGVEGVSSGVQGNPSGAYLTGIGTGDAKSADISGSSVSSTDLYWIALADPYRNVSGQPQMVAITLRHGATNFSPGNRISLNFKLGRQATTQFFPYVATSTGGGSWVPTAGTPLLSARTAAGALVGDTSGISRAVSLNWNDAATTNLYQGNVWTVESGCRLTAVSFSVFPVDDGDIALRLYVNGTQITNSALPEVNISHVSGELAEFAGIVTVPVAPTVLEAGDVVRMVLEPTTSEGIFALPRLQFTNSSDRLAFTRGVDIQYTEGSSTPTWNDDDEFIACIFPVIDQIHFSGGVNLGGSVGTTGAKFSVRSGKSEFIAQVFIPDASSASGEGLTGLTHASGGLRAYYMRSDASAPVGFNSGGTAGTLVTMTAGEWADSGFVEIDDENMPGWYQVGIPDEAFEAGADSVCVLLRGAPNMPPINIDIAIDQEVTLAPRGFDNLGAPTFIDGVEPVEEPVNTTLSALTWPERLWFASQWVVGGRVDNRDLKQLSILGNDNSTPKGVAEYTDVGGIVTVNNMDLA